MTTTKDPIAAWEAHCKTLRLDPVRGGEPLPQKGTRITHIIEGDEVTGLCRHTGTVVFREEIVRPEKVEPEQKAA